ncbi:MAG: hypothetical protein AB7S38_28795 [Vulcanimicrobiota bacterium]
MRPIGLLMLALMPDLAEQLKVKAYGPCRRCEEVGDQADLVIPPPMTAYIWDGHGRDPNHPGLMCRECASDYLRDWADTWEETDGYRMSGILDHLHLQQEMHEDAIAVEYDRERLEYERYRELPEYEYRELPENERSFF